MLIGALLHPNPAAAQVDPWEFEVYPYKTMGRGVLEIETDNAKSATLSLINEVKE